MHFLVDLLFQDSCCCFNCFVRFFRILSAGLSHVRTTAAATAYDRCDTFDEVSCMCSCFLSCICSHGKEIYFAAVYSCKDNNDVLDKIGGAHLASLKVIPGLGYAKR